jgi:adenylate kinase
VNIILFGPPAAGKGTQARYLVARGYTHLSTGEMLRDAVLTRSPLGIDVEQTLAEGKLVADYIVTELVARRISKQGNFLFDGYPRTMWQAISLDSLLAEIERKIDLVIELQVDTKKIFSRVCERYKAEQRADDNPASFAVRLKAFEDMQHVLAHYQKKGVVKSVDGMQAPEDIAHEIEKWIS